MDPLEICGGIYPPTVLYLVWSIGELILQREMPDYISAQRSNIRLPPKCYCGGGSTYFAYAPWFRTPQYKTYWKFIEVIQIFTPFNCNSVWVEYGPTDGQNRT